MGSLCLSSAAILRCESLDRIQVIILVIPTVFEVIFSSSLIFTMRGTNDRQYLWLTSEGWIYLVLSLLEMVSHLLPAGRLGEQAFKVFDTVLAVSSFLPILFYTLFILLFSRAELITVLPARFRTISKLMLPMFIILIGSFNQLASLIGISHDIVIPGRAPVLVGFKNKKDETLWTFFTSLTLALLTAYQAIGFVFAFYRLIEAIVDKRRIQTTEADEAHLFRGIGWICGGFKLGAIETVLGFAGGAFGVTLARRILRFLARAFVCIGITMGLDCLEDFGEVQRELALSKASRQVYRQSRIREFISNPRLSTFRQLSPTATAFHAAPRAPGAPLRPSPLAHASEDIPNMTQASTIDPSTFQVRERPYQRVTMNFKNGTPVLDVRFSELDVPGMITGKSRSSLQSDVVMGSRGSRVLLSPPSKPNRNQVRSSQTPSLLSLLDLTSESGSEGQAASSLFYNPYAQQPERHLSLLSDGQEPHMSPLAAVRELTAQFPVVPPRPFIPPNQITVRPGNRDFSNRGSPVTFGNTDNTSMMGNLSHASSSPSKRQSGASATADINMRLKYIRSNPAPIDTSTLPIRTPDLDDGLLNLGTAMGIGKSKEAWRSGSRGANPAEWIDYDAIQPAGGNSVRTEEEEGMSQVLLEPRGADVRRKDGRKVGDSSAGTRGSRIKGLSIGAVPRRLTPTPIRTRFTRGSLRLESIVIAHPVMTNEGLGSSLDSVYSQDVLRDAEVVAIGG